MTSFPTEDHKRGNITFFSTYRPPVPLEIYSARVPGPDEAPMLDGESYNYNGQAVPPAALKAILKHKKLDHRDAKPADVDSGRVTGLVFVSERTGGLETLHLALRFNDDVGPPRVDVFSFAEVYDTYDGVRLEDSGCFAGDNLVYVSTKDPADRRRQPWTAVYKTNLKNGKTHRLTPQGVADLSPSASPSGTKIALASWQEKPGGWTGEIEDLKTDIFVMNVNEPHRRTLVIKDGGWPSWGSDDVLFFHRKVGDYWGVFRADISGGGTPVRRVTPEGIDAVTPAAIDEARVAVATIRQKSKFRDVRVEAQYRHVEIFDSLGGPGQESIRITEAIKPLADHFNPFVIVDRDGGLRIGYHRCHDDVVEGNDFQKQINEVKSPQRDIGVCRVGGAFPSFSKDGTKLAFVDNEFKTLYVADYDKGLRVVYQAESPDSIFSPLWNQNAEKDTLYVCMGHSFKADATVQICAIPNISNIDKDVPLPQPQPLTVGEYNNAFPSTNPEGTKLVFRSTRDGGEARHKNLYIMEDTLVGEVGGKITRLTNGAWTDTHCEWSPRGDWIAFSSTRDKPGDAPETDNGLDPGYFAVFLVKADDPNVVVRVIGSGENLVGHVNHPFFSPDGKSIVVVSDLAGVSADPISLPLFLHSVRPYGDIFAVDIDPHKIDKNKDVKRWHRMTHSRFENSTASWAMVTLVDLERAWELIQRKHQRDGPFCPYLHQHGGHTFHLTGHIHVPNRLC